MERKFLKQIHADLNAFHHAFFTRVNQMKTLNIIFYVLSWTIQCADPWLISRCAAISFTVTRRFSFTKASTTAMSSGVTTGCAWPGRGESVTELMPFINFLVLVNHHTELSFVYEFWWVSPLNYKKRMTERCSSLMHFARGPPHLHYYCAVALHSCIVLPPVDHSSNRKYHCCQLTRQSSCISNFYRAFKVFIWLSLVQS